ncbi:MAG: hypothetical protein ACKO6A_06885 [Bacteroidota bacterium]
MSSKLSIVIPTYNEEGNITLLYDQLKEVLNIGFGYLIATIIISLKYCIFH